jgi:RNA polymerase-binding transcription factor DksA
MLPPSSRKSFADSLPSSHRIVTIGAQDEDMDIATSNPAVTARITPASLGRFPVESVENHLAPDWRPGEAQGKKRPEKPLTAFLRVQRENLLELREALVGSMYVIAQETRDKAADKSALGSDLGDAGSDTYDRDFSLSLLSEGSSAVLEIDEALSRIERGTYGVCEMSGRSIPLPRLRAVPFARFTVECQVEIEKGKKLSRSSRPFESSPFAVADHAQVEEELMGHSEGP